MTDRTSPSQVEDVEAELAAEDEGKTALFRALFEREFAYVWTTLRRLGVRDADLEDVANELFFHVHARLADYDTTRPLRPWLFAFAFRFASDYRRLARHRVEVFGDSVDAASVEAPQDASLERNEARALITRALEDLDLDRRAIFVLVDLDECPVPDAAKALAIPLNTAYSRLRVAREQFTASVRRLNSRRDRP